MFLQIWALGGGTLILIIHCVFAIYGPPKMKPRSFYKVFPELGYILRGLTIGWFVILIISSYLDAIN